MFVLRKIGQSKTSIFHIKTDCEKLITETDKECSGLVSRIMQYFQLSKVVIKLKEYLTKMYLSLVL